MNKNKSKLKINNLKIKFGLVFVVITGILIGVGLVRGESNTSDNIYNWSLKPVMVNIQVDLEKEGDQATVSDILNEIEKYNGHATVFVTGEFASKYPEVIRDIESKEHQIAIHGWQKREDLTFLNAQEQLELIQRAFSAVRNAVNKPEEVLDFKPQGYKFNDDTIRILQEIGAKSISGIFSCEESFCKCWYAQQVGKITFPYPITNEFWAIPISEVKINSKDTPLDDEYINNPQEFLNYLLEKYNQQTETKDPLIFVVHPSIAGVNTAKLKIFSQFLEYVEQNGGKIKPLSSLTHHTQYITNFDATGPNSASVGEDIIINVNYTSNIYCPHYRFRVYGKYKESTEGWEKLGSYCEFVYTGSHSFSRKIKIPPIPQIIPPPEEYIYQIRVVGRASYGGCGESELWPTYDSYQAGAMKDIEIEVTKPLCIPYIINGSEGRRKDVVFVPDKDYWEDYGENALNKFKEDMAHKINDRLGGVSPIKENMDRFNFYYTEEEGDSTQKPKALPANFWEDESCKFADTVMILHTTVIGDSCGPVDIRVCSSEGPTRDLPSSAEEVCNLSGTKKCAPGVWEKFDRSFIHESGHGIFGLRDEYDGDQENTRTKYNSERPLPSNIWESEESCRSDATSQGWNPDECYQFTSTSWGGNWWKLGDSSIEDHNARYLDPNYRYIMLDGSYFYNGFGKASERRIKYVFDELFLKGIDILYPCDWCPKYAEKLAENSVSLYLNINNGQLTLLESEFSESPSPNYYLGDYPFRAEIISLTGELLGQYGFGDPRVILAEIGYEGPTWIDNVDFPLILPYFHNAKTVNIYNSADVLLLSVDIAQYDKGIMEGQVTDYNGNPVANAFIQIGGTSEGSTYANENGEYQLLVEPGYYEIGVTPDPYTNLMPVFTSVSVGVGEIITQNFSLSPAGSIAGQVSDINGNPVPDVNVYLSGYETPHYATNEEGKYIIPGLQAGTYTVNVDTFGTIFVDTSATIEVILGQTTILDFVLGKGGAITGKVTNKEGSAISGAYVYVYGPSYGDSYTDEAGYYSISRLLEGTYTVRVCPPYGLNLVCSSVTAEVREGETTIVNIILPEAGIIAGRITDPEGNGVSNIYVYAYGPGWGYSYTDEEGYYSISGLETGTYIVQVNTWGTIFVDTWATVEVVVGQTTTLDFVLIEGGRITGKVTDMNGIGIANVYLYTYGPSYGYDYTDEAGNYSIVGLKAGTYTVNIYAPGYGRWYILVNNTLVKYGTSVSFEVTLEQTTWVDFTQQPPPSPNILVDPQSFEITLPADQITTATLIIGNSGNALLEFEIKDYSLGMIIDDPAEGGAFDVKKIFVNFTPTNINFNVETYTSLEGGNGYGYFWLDMDQNPLTGATEGWYPGYGLNDIGADYILYFYFSDLTG